MLGRLSSLMSESLGRFHRTDILDVFFPGLCPSCKVNPTENNKLCSACENSIEYLERLSKCTVCGVPLGYFEERSKETEKLQRSTEESHLCAKCLGGRYCFKKARSVALYKGAVRELLHAFKYEGKLKLADTLSDIIIEHNPFDLCVFDVVVPVPLYIAKLRQRQYNQSAVLASFLGKRLGVRADLRGLTKIRDTRPQIEIKDEAQRRKNVRGAFKVRIGRSFNALSVLLLDDVFTTGSTSDECSQTLLKSGAKRVEVLTLSRAGGI